MEVYSLQLSSQIWNLLPLGKAVQQPAPGRTHLRIHSASNSVIPSTNSDCLPCARRRENGSEQSSHITGLLGSSSELEKWAVKFLGRTTDLGSTLRLWPSPDPTDTHLSGNLIRCPEEAGVDSTVWNNWCSGDSNCESRWEQASTLNSPISEILSLVLSLVWSFFKAPFSMDTESRSSVLEPNLSR